ncbi:MAG: hypothetical protein PHQ11_08215 [Paludibacter sp.]|nr:hypothetical protein [Paludibacter sp.]MDD4429073.1 hypothetical protein [Paludibacter sp.]
MGNDILSKKVDLIYNEVELSCDFLAKAYTIIPKINYGAKQQTATFMFLSYNGLERLLKLIFILDHYLNNHNFPTVKEMKKKGHSIKELFLNAYDISVKRDCSNEDMSNAKDLDFIRVLSDFAVKGRYYNLDNILEDNPEDINYLVEFYCCVESMFFKNHNEIKVNQIPPQILKKMEIVSHIHFTNFDGQPIDTIEKGLLHSQLSDKYMKNFQFEFYKIVRGVISVLEDIVRENNKQLRPIMFVYEFWRIFKCEDSYIKKRRTLSIY